MNFGIGGYDTQQEVLCYEAYVRKYKPDLVALMMYPHNDFVGNIFYQFERDFGRPYFKMAGGELQKIGADPKKLRENYRQSLRREQMRWYHHLHVYNAQKNILYHFRQARRQKEEVNSLKLAPMDAAGLEKFWKVFGYRKYRYYASNENDPFVAEVDMATRLLLERLQAMARRDGVRLCVALLPSEENLWPERWPQRVKNFPGMERFRMDFERSFRRVPSFLPDAAIKNDLLDLRPVLREAAKEGPVFFYHDFHYNERGQKAVADALTPWLETKLGKFFQAK